MWRREGKVAMLCQNLQPPPGGLCGPSELRGAPVWDDIQDFSDG